MFFVFTNNFKKECPLFTLSNVTIVERLNVTVCVQNGEERAYEKDSFVVMRGGLDRFLRKHTGLCIIYLRPEIHRLG